MSDVSQAPRRLLELDGPAGDCLREALSGAELLRPSPRFAQLRELRLRRLRRRRGLALLGLAATTIALALRGLHQDEPPPSIYAELAAPSVQGPAAVGSSRPEAGTPPAPPSPDGRPTPLAVPSVAPRKSLGTRPSEEARPVPSAVSSAEVGGGAKSCAELARSGGTPAALDCYAKLGAGSGMTAELALFEQARLEGKVLRRPERALLVLEDYRRRFPGGTLRAEVMLAQIDWLLGAGDSVRALQVVDEALGSGLLRERKAELERLRANLTAAVPRDGAVER